MYIVPCPIGNMGDISSRALNALESADFVACEDSRVTGKLLMLLGLKKELVQHHEHNKRQSVKYIVSRLSGGESCALLSDAGTPAVSDPGTELVDACAAAGIRVTPLPGPCAAVCAVSASGMDCRRFVFEGFLPDKGARRRERLEALAHENRPAVLYCAPHDIKALVAQLRERIGNRRLFVARELTKLNEQLVLTDVEGAAAMLESGEIPCRGEFTLVLGGAQAAKEAPFWSGLSMEEHMERYTSRGMSRMEAMKAVAKDRGVSKSSVYAALERG